MAEYGVVLAVITIGAVARLHRCCPAGSRARSTRSSACSRSSPTEPSEPEKERNVMNLSELHDLHRMSPSGRRARRWPSTASSSRVITLAVRHGLHRLSGGVIGAINKVIGLLPRRSAPQVGPASHRPAPPPSPPPNLDPHQPPMKPPQTQRAGPDDGRVRAGRPDPLPAPVRRDPVRDPLQGLRHDHGRRARRRSQGGRQPAGGRARRRRRGEGARLRLPTSTRRSSTSPSIAVPTGSTAPT